MDYARLIQAVRFSGDLDAARRLYVEAGRRSDWEHGMLAASLLHGAVPLTPEAIRTGTGRVVKKTAVITNTFSGMLSVGSVIVGYNEAINFPSIDGYSSSYECLCGEHGVSCVRRFEGTSQAVLEQAAQKFRDVGWDVDIVIYDTHAGITFRIPKHIKDNTQHTLGDTNS